MACLRPQGPGFAGCVSGSEDLRGAPVFGRFCGFSFMWLLVFCPRPYVDVTSAFGLIIISFMATAQLQNRPVIVNSFARGE